MLRYPEILHVEGSSGGGDDVPFVSLANIDCQILTAEIWLDGIHFSLDNDRGFLRHWHQGSPLPMQPEYNLLKDWSTRRWIDIVDTLTDRYEVHGKWCYPRQHAPYTSLPCYGFHTDLYDREEGHWVSTPFRRQILGDLHDSDFQPAPVVGCWKPERFQSPGFENELLRVVEEMPEQYLFGAPQCMGLLLKAERGGKVLGFYKFVRPVGEYLGGVNGRV